MTPLATYSLMDESVSNKWRTHFFSCRLFTLSSPALAPLLSSWGQAAHLSSTPSPTISLPFASPVISALVSLLSVVVQNKIVKRPGQKYKDMYWHWSQGTAQIDTTFRTEAESAAALLGKCFYLDYLFHHLIHTSSFTLYFEASIDYIPKSWQMFFPTQQVCQSSLWNPCQP